MARFFSDRTLGFKLTAIFLSVILIPMLLLAYISYRVMDERLMKEARKSLETGMRSAWTEYYMHADQMRYGMLQAATMEEIENAVLHQDRAYLKKQMTRWKHMRPYVDIWAVVDAGGNVMARLNSDAHGDTMRLNGMVENAMLTGEPVTSTELLPGNEVKLEGEDFVRRAYESTRGFYPQGGEKGDEELMALIVVTPVVDQHIKGTSSVIGAIITADVLNIENHISVPLEKKIPGLFTTVSRNGVRISTNLVDASGRNLSGVRLPDEAAATLSRGKSVFLEWSLPGGASFLSMFEPIRDFNGKIVGSLDVSVSKERLWAIQKENQRVIAAITLLGVSISLAAALVSAFKLTRPLRSLKDKISAFARGDFSARVDVDWGSDTKDELKLVAANFNSMMEEVGRKEEEKGRYLKEIEEKNRKYAELNEAMRVTNEELEVAYEETQSQTEELHAINEELKLLNEDLDRKNLELQKANSLITQEEDELKRAKDKLRLIYDGIRDDILLVDHELKVLEANRNFTERLKVEESMVIGKRVYGLLGIDKPVQDCPVRKAIDAGSPVQAEMSMPEGRVCMWHVFPLLDGRGEPLRAVVYIKDVTEQRMFTNKLIQTDKLSSLGELVSGVAHELNNPLTGIMCFSELLIEDRLGEDVKAKLRKINDASHRCKKIIDNLLTFARWKKPEKKFEDLNKVIRESVELRAYQLKVDNIEVVLDLDESLPGTMLDENQIHQVFLNLINNARDAIKDKGERGRIRITSRQAGDTIVVTVEDTGKGMTQEVAGRIFDPFFTTKGVGKGTGLGLSISYGIINEHGGNIYARSAPGAGATFVVELPVVERKGTGAKEEAAPDPLRAELIRARARGLKALVLDDEQIVLDILCETLSKHGFAVDKATNGEEAILKFRASDYDIVISDIKMPGTDGKAFYRQLTALKPGSLKKIVFISGDSVNKETQEFLKETGNIYLKKPFTVDQLNEVISRVIF